MKKFSYLAASLMLTVAVTAAPALARNNFNNALTQQAQMSDEERKAYEGIYQPCFGKEKNDEKCYPLAKDFAEKFPNSQYIKYVKGKIEGIENTRLFNAYQDALKKLYDGPGDAIKLEAFLAATTPYVTKFPTDTYAVAQLAMATGNGILADYYKDMAKAREYASKALPALESATTPPQGWKAEEWAKFRLEAIGNITLQQAGYELRQSTPNVDQALVYLNKIISNKDWPAAKQPPVYLLRAEANNLTYDKLSSEYRALTEDEKRGEKGKETLAKIDPVVDAMIDDYARALAIASKNPAYKATADDVRPRLEGFWKYRYGKLDGMDEFIK
ncbi:MAG TPA: hypothetical protein VEF04_13645, partial [Blastocatellia bacterium]|nr:hypothetical protein [Blastocatellia bacterium]